MVHPVRIESYTPKGRKPGRVAFTLDGRLFHARCDADADEARDLLIAGTTYPLALTIAANGKVDYSEPGATGLRVEKADVAGDQISFLARTWQTIDQSSVFLQSEPQVALRLVAPQFATDFRGGSWLRGTGTLLASLPEDHHE